MEIPLADQLECVRRELSYRRRVYPRLVAAGKMTQQLAHTQMELMQAVEKTLEKLEPSERLL